MIVSVHGDQAWSGQQRNLAVLRADAVVSRLARRDIDLWGEEGREDARHRLGWLDVAASWPSLVDRLKALREELRAEGVTRIVLCAMGGSSLAAEVICRHSGVPLTVVDSTHPDEVRRALGRDLHRTVVVVSSKSGRTLETDCQRRSFIGAFASAGVDARARIIVVTDPGSPLEELARTEAYREVFLADPNVGGRFSALTAFGLVPAALAGAELNPLLHEASSALAQIDSDDPPGLQLGAALAVPGGDKLALDVSGSGLAGFAEWVEQLLAESTGKQGVGLLPVPVGASAPEAQSEVRDVRVVRFAAPAPQHGILVTGGLGAQFVAWCQATAVAGRLLAINPFDQPDVESAKDAARELLGNTVDLQQPAFVDGDVEVHGDPALLAGATTVAAAVTELLRTLTDDGYLAVMAYLDRGRDQLLTTVRAPLARRTGRPVTFGWGPRLLHSAGQFHKGGPPVGVFLQITGHVEFDLPVPGRDFNYAQLIAAQAERDAQVLTGLGRPLLRLHLRSGDGLRQLLEWLS